MAVIKKYLKNPVEVQAALFDGTPDHRLAEWCDGTLMPIGQGKYKMVIVNADRNFSIAPGHYIVRGPDGKFYKRKASDFVKAHTEKG